MPKRKRVSGQAPPILNPAAAVLGAGVQPDRWDRRSIMESMTRRYTQLIQFAEQAKDRGRIVRVRTLYAGAYELASVLTDYYRDQGPSGAEDFERWDRRRKIAHTHAYTTTNPIAENIGAGTPHSVTSIEP